MFCVTTGKFYIPSLVLCTAYDVPQLPWVSAHKDGRLLVHFASLRHYFIRPLNISFPQRKMRMYSTPLHQCCCWFPLSPVLAKSFSLISEDHSDKTHPPLLRSPSSLYPISQTGLSLLYYPKPFSPLCFHSSKSKQDFFQTYALNLSKQRPYASACDNRALHQMATRKEFLLPGIEVFWWNNLLEELQLVQIKSNQVPCTEYSH